MTNDEELIIAVDEVIDGLDYELSAEDWVKLVKELRRVRFKQLTAEARHLKEQPQ